METNWPHSIMYLKLNFDHGPLGQLYSMDKYSKEQSHFNGPPHPNDTLTFWRISSNDKLTLVRFHLRGPSRPADIPT